MKFAAGKALSARGPLLVTAVAAGALAGAAASLLVAGDSGGGPAVAARLNLDKAAGAALKKVPGGRIEGLELGYNGRTLAWEADVVARDGSSRELHIDARDGRVLADRLDPPEEGEDGDDCEDLGSGGRATGLPDQVTALRSVEIAATRAARIALDTVPGTMTSVDFEYRPAAPFWDIDITAKDGLEHKLQVDAATGKVIVNAPDEKDT